MLSPFHPIHMVTGLVVWAGYFVVLYSAASIGCGYFPPATDAGLSKLSLILLAITLVVTLALLFQTWRIWQAIKRAERPNAVIREDSDDSQPTRHFIEYVSLGVYLVASLATLFIGLPSIFLLPCH